MPDTNPIWDDSIKPIFEDQKVRWLRCLSEDEAAEHLYMSAGLLRSLREKGVGPRYRVHEGQPIYYPKDLGRYNEATAKARLALAA